MGKGSEVSQKLLLQIVEQFQNNVPQHKVAKTLSIPSSTVHNIIIRFRESGDIVVCKGHSWKPILDLRNLLGPQLH